MYNRGVTTESEINLYLNGNITQLRDAEAMTDMSKACGIVLSYVRSHKKIRIFGDYDVDGVCSSSILYRGLKALNADVDVTLPHRVHDGYGINEIMVNKAHAEGVDLILTCDNGIAAYGPISRAKELGMCVVVTDHHEVPYDEDTDTGARTYRLPPADAIVDPKQPGDVFGFTEVCGAYIAYRFILCLFKAAGIHGAEELHNFMIQLAALATVCDVMSLTDDNHLLVRAGMRMMTYEACKGIKELISVTGLLGKEINVFHLGFILGPCINAAGRIDTPVRALKLFTTDDATEVMQIAKDLRELNESRKTMTDKALESAEELINSEEYAGDKVFVIYLRECHESINGLVAGKIKEKYGRPTLVLSDSGGKVKGSARSIPAYNIYDALYKVSDCLLNFGGHSQAAGFALKRDKVAELRKRLNEECTLTEEDFTEELDVDMIMPLSEIDGALLNNLERLAPYGNGNRKARFLCTGLELVSCQFYGKGDTVGKYGVRKDGSSYEVTVFRENEEFMSYLTEKYGRPSVEAVRNGNGSIPLSIVYTAQWNEFRGNKDIQIVMEDYR